MTHDARPRRAVGALLEALRAPLLLSPAADAYAGWLLVALLSPLVDEGPATAWRLLAVPPEGLLPLLACAAAGCCLLASGMAQNALADRAEDHLSRPERPLPRGAIGARVVTISMLVLGAAGLALLSPWSGGPTLGLSIVIGTAVYHAGLKRRRVPGCVLLGALRGLSMALGVVAASHVSLTHAAHPADHAAAWLGCGLYGLYITGASLHASTDDESEPGPWSPAGLSLCSLVLLLWSLVALARMSRTPGLAGTGLVLFAWAALRLHRARHGLPAPAVTGVALSGLHLLHAGVAALVAGPAAAAVVLLLFGISRALLRIYPPS